MPFVPHPRDGGVRADAAHGDVGFGGAATIIVRVDAGILRALCRDHVDGQWYADSLNSVLSKALAPDSR